MPKPSFSELYSRRARELLGDDYKTAAVESVDLDKKWTPEEWYQEIKKRWYFHPTSWYMIEASILEELTQEEKLQTCNGWTGCIPQCRFYAPEGTITEEERQRNIASLTKYIEWKKRPCSPETCKNHPDHHKHNNHKEEEINNDEQK